MKKELVQSMKKKQAKRPTRYTPKRTRKMHCQIHTGGSCLPTCEKWCQKIFFNSDLNSFLVTHETIKTTILFLSILSKIYISQKEHLKKICKISCMSLLMRPVLP